MFPFRFRDYLLSREMLKFLIYSRTLSEVTLQCGQYLRVIAYCYADHSNGLLETNLANLYLLLPSCHISPVPPVLPTNGPMRYESTLNCAKCTVCHSCHVFAQAIFAEWNFNQDNCSVWFTFQNLLKQYLLSDTQYLLKWHARGPYFCHKKAHARRLFRWARERRKWERERARGREKEKRAKERKKGKVKGERKREWASENLRVSGDLAEGRNRKLVLHLHIYIYIYIVLQWCSVDCCYGSGTYKY